MAYTNRELFARMIQCEAGGEGDDGMRAVATVIMNRVNVSSGEYLRTGMGNLRTVMLQPGQFDCVRTTVAGRSNAQNIYNMNPEPIHYEIADWAIGGGLLNAAGDCLWYMNPFRPACPPKFPYNGSGTIHTRINRHCLYRPTAAYKNT